MEINKILQADYLDLIFDNRNKKYGSYELRKRYQSRSMKALGLMLTAVCLSVATPYAYGKLFSNTNNLAALPFAKTDTVTTILKHIYEQPKPEKSVVAEKIKTPNASIAKTVAAPVLKIVPNEKVTKPVTANNDIKDVVGPVSNPGNNGIHTATTTDVPLGPPGGSGKIENETIDVVHKEPVYAADVMPEYDGGAQALLNYLRKNMNYPADARQAEKQGKVMVRFVVNEFGAVENVQIAKSLTPSCDREALRVVKAMKAWKPGSVKGKAVKVYYMLPITFRLD